MFKILIGDIMFDFNNWREKYDSYSFKKQGEIYNELEELYPEQICFTLPFVEGFLKNIEKPKILELGGYKGELAKDILECNDDIVLWHNYELSSNAIEKNVCTDERYKPILLKDFAWNLDVFTPYNVCILSHIIEHIKQKQLKKFLEKIPNIKHIYIEAPLHRRRDGWHNRGATHILECGWGAIRNMLRDYKEIVKRKDVRCYIK